MITRYEGLERQMVEANSLTSPRKRGGEGRGGEERRGI